MQPSGVRRGREAATSLAEARTEQSAFRGPSKSKSKSKFQTRRLGAGAGKIPFGTPCGTSFQPWDHLLITPEQQLELEEALQSRERLQASSPTCRSPVRATSKGATALFHARSSSGNGGGGGGGGSRSRGDKVPPSPKRTGPLAPPGGYTTFEAMAERLGGSQGQSTAHSRALGGINAEAARVAVPRPMAEIDRASSRATQGRAAQDAAALLTQLIAAKQQLERETTARAREGRAHSQEAAGLRSAVQALQAEAAAHCKERAGCVPRAHVVHLQARFDALAARAGELGSLHGLATNNYLTGKWSKWSADIDGGGGQGGGGQGGGQGGQGGQGGGGGGLPAGIVATIDELRERVQSAEGRAEAYRSRLLQADLKLHAQAVRAAKQQELLEQYKDIAARQQEDLEAATAPLEAAHRSLRENAHSTRELEGSLAMGRREQVACGLVHAEALDGYAADLDAYKAKLAGGWERLAQECGRLEHQAAHHTRESHEAAAGYAQVVREFTARAEEEGKLLDDRRVRLRHAEAQLRVQQGACDTVKEAADRAAARLAGRLAADVADAVDAADVVDAAVAAVSQFPARPL